MTTTTSDATAAGNTKNNQRRMKKDGLSSSGGSISLIESTPNGVAVGSSNNISSSNRAMPIKSVLKSSLQSMEQEQQQQYHLQQRMQQQQQEQQKTSTSRPTRMSNIYKWFEHKFRCCCLYCFRCNSGNHVRYRFYLQRFLNTSQWWKYVLIINTFILLFGSSVRDIFLPSNSDVFFNILFVITFVIFSIDILLRIYAEPHYFNYNFCGCRKHKNNHNELMDHNNNTTATTMTRGGGDESASGMFVNQSPSQRQTPIRTGDAMSSTNKNIASMTSVKAVRGSHMDLIGNRKRPGTSNEGTSSMVRNYNNYNQNVVVAGWGSNYFGFSLGSFLFWCDVLSTLTLLSEISWINPRKFKEQQIVILVDAVFGIPITRHYFNTSPDAIVEIDSIELLIVIGKSARMARFIRSSAALQWSSKVNWYFFLNLFNLSWWYIQCCIGCFPCFFKHGKSGDKDYLQRYSMSSHPLTPTTSDVPVTPSSTPGQSTKFSAVAESDSSFFGLTGNGASQSIALQFLWTMSSLMGRSKFDIQQRHNMAAIIIQRAWRRRRHAANNDSFDYGLHFEKSAYFDNNQSISSNIGGSCKDIANGSSTRLAIVRSIRQSFQPGGAMRRNSNENNASDAGGGGANRSRTRMTRNPSARASSATSSMIADTLNNRNESQVGSAMRELTGQRVAIGIIVALVMTVLFTYTESNTTRQSAMITLHTQTKYDNFADLSIDAARRTSIPDLFSYKMANGITRAYDVVENRKRPSDLRPREILTIRVADNDGTSTSTIGSFSVRSERREQALVALLSTFFIILIWFFGATSFAGPVMVLVVFPMERMVRLLAMLMVDPLGYQSSSRYRKFVDEEDEITRNTRWTKEVLKGMETSFLMSTILRIGSLMKVGFGSAGVEIIRKNLERGRSQNMLTFSSQGSTVSCIFVFCDIRNFTDATECLQEEVFVFTNQIAAVVHSYCAAYGGSANKNIGDAFLLSWSLDDVADGLGYTAKNNQADKALLAVVRMCMSLRYDEYYMGKMSQFARDALVTKLKNREGPIVQMGFGLHAGKAVQGAIGSQKKIDATYVSESVERSEFLESSTKKYGLLLLMSDDFHRLLDQRNKRRCRKVDQILMREDDGNEEEDDVSGEIMDLLTFDIDIDAWWGQGSAVEGITSAEQESVEYTVPKKQARQKPRKLSLFNGSNEAGDREAEMPSDLAMSKARRIMHGLEEVENSGMFGSKQREKKLNAGRRPEFLVLPRGPALYNANVWSNQDMRKIRERYSDGIFFQKFNSGLQAFYNRDWEHALECFSTVLSRFDDGPSRYFLNQIEKNNGKPPKDFRGYGVA